MNTMLLERRSDGERLNSFVLSGFDDVCYGYEGLAGSTVNAWEIQVYRYENDNLLTRYSIF